MRLVVLGAGAIGSLLGGLLSEAGLHVTLIGRLPHVKAIQSKGLHIDGVSGHRTIKVKAGAKPSAIRDKVDIVLCTVKAYDTRQAAIDAKPLIDKECLFLCMQNGLNVENEAAEVLGVTNVARGVTNNGALFVKPGYIKHTGLSDTIIGCPGERWRSRLEELTSALSTAGLPAKITDDIQKVVWSKVLVNVGINAIGAITHLRNGELLKDPSLRSLMRSAVQEGSKIAQKLGINFDEDVVEKTFKVAEATASNKNSMLQDVEKGKRTEIDFMNGAIVRIGEQLGAPTPINNTLTALVKGLEPRKTS
nr:2-dehydropantoate 2-reductase [Candidatus Njordarchaeum guaymaensis]